MNSSSHSLIANSAMGIGIFAPLAIAYYATFVIGGGFGMDAGELVLEPAREAARREAISYAMYRMMLERHAYSRTATNQAGANPAFMAALG